MKHFGRFPTPPDQHFEILTDIINQWYPENK